MKKIFLLGSILALSLTQAICLRAQATQLSPSQVCSNGTVLNPGTLVIDCSVTIPRLVAMDNAKMAEINAALAQIVVKNGSYVGMDSAGHPCGLIANQGNGYSTIETVSGRLQLLNPISEATYFLLAYSFENPANGFGQHLHLSIITHRQEAMGKLDIIDIFANRGVPFSVQSSAGFPLGSRFNAGDKIRLYHSPLCSGTVIH
jgi:hypothetical protein